MKQFAFLPCLFALAAAASANASTLYNNAGPGSYTTAAWYIGYVPTDGNFSIADSFSLSSPAIINAISFGNWLSGGNTLESVDWEITTEPNGGTVLASGTATAFSNVYEGSPNGFTVNDSTFSIEDLSLDADTTYYLEFSDAMTNSSNDIPAWDESDNTSNGSAYYYYLNGSIDGALTGSETFALYGIPEGFKLYGPPVVPEPPSLLLLGSGLAGLLLLGRMRRRAMMPPSSGSCA